MIDEFNCAVSNQNNLYVKSDGQAITNGDLVVGLKCVDYDFFLAHHSQ
jgi:hypothetical protein